MVQRRSAMLHELFETVLSRQELSRAGELFSLEDQEVLPCVAEVLCRIREAVSRQSYTRDDNAQSVVEISLARVLAAIRDGRCVERYCGELVSLLEACLQHELSPRARRSEHPPHAKVAADVMSCIFLHQPSSRALTARSVGATVRFLHRGNRELARSVTQHLCLAASQNADLLISHVQPVVDSIIAGNYALCKVLPSIYALRHREPAITDHLLALFSLLPQCEKAERLSLLALFELMAKSDANILDGNLSQLTAYLNDESAAPSVMRIFTEVSNSEPQLLIDLLPKVQQLSLGKPHLTALTARLYANVANTNRDMARISLDMLSLLLSDASSSPGAQVAILREIKSILDSTSVSLSSLALDKINQLHFDPSSTSMIQFYLQQIRRQQGSLRDLQAHSISQHSQSLLSHTASLHHGLTAAVASPTQVYYGTAGPNVGYHSFTGPGYSRASDTLPSGATLSAYASTSTSATSTPNGGGSGSQQQLLSSSRPSLTSSHTGLGGAFATTHLLNGSLQTLGSASRGNPTGNAASSSGTSSGANIRHASHSHVQLIPIHRSLGTLGSRAVLYTTNGCGNNGLKGSGNRLGAALSHGGVIVGAGTSSHRSTSASIAVLVEEPLSGSVSPKEPFRDSDTAGATGISENSVRQTSLTQRVPDEKPTGSGFQVKVSTFVRNRMRNNNNNNSNNHNNNSSNNNNNNNNISNTKSGLTVVRNKCGDRDNDEGGADGSTNEQSRLVAGSGVGVGGVPFEPLRDAVQHFSEKHLDKIRAFMAGVFARLPLPLKCTIEERHSGKKYAKLHFGCQGKGGNCLYDRTLFASKTKYARLWIHLMFLAVQARSPLALGQRDPSLAALRHCWDSLRPADGRSFLALVTSAFPSAKDMECLMSELRSRRFLDVFEYNGALQMWACFLCNHPDRAHGFLQESLPVIEGQLKEKRRRWKLFRQWRTKYFTLSGANLSCRELSSDSKDQPIGEVQSVRAIQGRNRHIPKAFEIFTADDKAFVLKAASRRHTEEWVQCLSIALARTHASSGQAGGQSSQTTQNSFDNNEQQLGNQTSQTQRQHQSDRERQGLRNNNDRRGARDQRDYQLDHQNHKTVDQVHQVHQVQNTGKMGQGGSSSVHHITHRL